MDRTKLLKIAFIALGLLIVIWLLSTIFGGDDDQEIAFREALIAQLTIVDISSTAVERASNPQTRTLAATIASTTLSDISLLSEHYTSRFGRVPSRGNSAYIDEVSGTSENLDRIYLETTEELLQVSYDNLQLLQNKSQSEEFSSALEVALENHRSHLDKLGS